MELTERWVCTVLRLAAVAFAACSSPEAAAPDAGPEATQATPADVDVLDTARAEGSIAATDGISETPAADGDGALDAAVQDEIVGMVDSNLDAVLGDAVAVDVPPGFVDSPVLDAGPAGSCKAGQFDAGGTCKTATCQGVGVYLTQAFGALVDSKQKCKTDAECAPVNMTTSCAPKCTIAVNPDAVAAINQLVNDVESAICKPLQVGSVCGTDKIVLKCPPVSVGCVKGWCAPDKPVETNDCPQPALANAKCYSGKWVCNEGWILAADGKTCVSLNCTALAEYVTTALGADVAAADKACQKETDCHFVNTGTACGPGCPVAVNLQGTATEGKKNSDLDSFCKASSFPEKCPKLPPVSCPPKVVSCKNGECVLGNN